MSEVEVKWLEFVEDVVVLCAMILILIALSWVVGIFVVGINGGVDVIFFKGGTIVVLVGAVGVVVHNVGNRWVDRYVEVIEDE